MNYTPKLALFAASLLVSGLAFSQTNEPAGTNPAETQSIDPSRRELRKPNSIPGLSKIDEYRQSDEAQKQSYNRNNQQPDNGNGRYGNGNQSGSNDRYNQPGYGNNQPGYNQPGYGNNQPGYGQPGYGNNQPGYGQRGYDNDRYGYDRNNDWRNRNWDGYGDNDYRADHDFWRGRWRDELGLSRGQRREMERIDDYYDRFRLDPRDPRFRQMQRQKFGDMLSVMTPQQRAIVLNRVQPSRGQYGRGYGQPGYGQPGYNPNRRSGSYGPYGGR